jgi:hypothetical protein
VAAPAPFSEEFLARLEHLSSLMMIFVLLLVLLGWGWRGLMRSQVMWNGSARGGILLVVLGMAALVASVVLLEAAIVPPHATTGPRTEASEAARREHLEMLRDALWKYAATHDGKMPTDRSSSDFSQELWRAPDEMRTPYGYLAPQTWGWWDMNPRMEQIRFGYASRKNIMGQGSHDVLVGDLRHYVLVYEQAPLGAVRFMITSMGQVMKLSAEDLQRRIAAEATELREVKVGSGKP